MRVRHVVWVSAALLAASALAGVGAPGVLRAKPGDAASGTFSVLGTGTVTTKPDTATTSFGVTTQAPSAREAIAGNSEAMAKVIEALKRAGVRAKDLQTQFVSLDPRYDDQGRAILGYTASNSVSAVVRDLDRVGALIDAGIAAGATNVGGPSLARDDRDTLYRDALAAAVADAREKAKVLAEAAGVTLGKIETIDESPQQSGPVAYPATFAARASADVPIEAGTSDVTAAVSVVFAVA